MNLKVLKMNKFFLLVFFLLVLPLTKLSVLNADAFPCNCKQSEMTTDESIHAQKGKLYIPREKIALVDDLILVEIEDLIFETPAIFTDENGFYVTEVKDDGCGRLRWRCKNCDECNSLFFSRCSKCKKPISRE